MPRPLTAILVPELLAKLKLLDVRHQVSRKEIELALGVSKATLSAYINGSDSKAKNRMPPERLDKLIVFLQGKNPSLSKEMARTAWLSEQLALFEQALQKPSSHSFATLLQASHQQLVITPIRYLHHPSRLGLPQLGMLADEDVAITSQASSHFVLPSNQSLRFDIATQAGHSLFAACETDVGWHQLLPGRRHSGRIVAALERVPQASEPAISFKAPFGPHRFIFIEAKLTHPLGRQAPQTLTTPLTANEIASLAETLLHHAQDWRWGEITIIVEPA